MELLSERSLKMICEKSSQWISDLRDVTDATLELSALQP